MATRRAWSGAMLLVGLLALPAWAQQGPTQTDLNAASKIGRASCRERVYVLV